MSNPYARVTEDFYDWKRLCFHKLIAFTQWLVFNIRWRFHVQGRENIPTHLGSYIVAATHSSNHDPPLIAQALGWRPIAYMAKKELFESPFNRFLYRNLGAFAVDRDKVEVATIRSAKTVLSTGRWALGIFPEGTRNKETQVGNTKKGVAFISKSCNAAILPLGISHWTPKRRHHAVCIGPILTPDGHTVETLAVVVDDTLRTLKEQAEAEAIRLNGF